MLLRVHGCSLLVMSRGHCIAANALVFWLLQSLCPLSLDLMVPETLGLELLVGVSVGVGHTMVAYPVHFDHLWIFLVASILGTSHLMKVTIKMMTKMVLKMARWLKALIAKSDNLSLAFGLGM